MFETRRLPLIIIVAGRGKGERKENWREEFESSLRIRMREKYGRGISAPARTAINHIISVNGACKTREGSASLFALSYNTGEERNTSSRMSDPNHVLRGTRVLEEGARRRGATGCAATAVPSEGYFEGCFDGIMRLWIVGDESRIVSSGNY